VFAPSAYLEFIVPVQERVDLRLYGFYIGEAKATAAQVDVPIRITKFLAVTPSYLYLAIPPSGLNEVASKRPPGDLLKLQRSTSSGSTGQSTSPCISSRSPTATCIREDFVPPMISTAIAIGSRSRIHGR
jgi:hypothetical protein